MKLTLKELREYVSSAIDNNVDFWGSEYRYDPRTDTTEKLVKGAMKWYHQDKSHDGYKSPKDPRFVQKLSNRMKLFGIDNHVISDVVSSL